MKKYLISLQFILLSTAMFSQMSWNAELNLESLISSEGKLPFWMVHNKRGRISQETNFLGWVTAKGKYLFNNESSLEIGGGFLVREAQKENSYIDELYAMFQTSQYSLTVGRKQQEEIYSGLSSSNRSILWSINTQPIPGLQLETTRPVFLLNNFGFEAAWEEFLLNDNRFVDNARLHHKSFSFVYSTSNRKLYIKAGIQHFAQWGGNSPDFGKQPEGFDDYFRVVTGLEGQDGATGSDQINALGNHLGGYEVSVFKQFLKFNVEMFYQHLFEDGSGRRLGNTPDGRYGIFYTSRKKNQIVNSVMYEFYTTHHQSHTTTGIHKNDNYFNNTGYRSGWTYFGRVLGSPFFTVNQDLVAEGSNYVIQNNKFTAHHLGLGGVLELGEYYFPHKLLLSFAENDGTRPHRYTPKQEVFYGLYNISFSPTASIELNLELAAEYNSYTTPIYGAGIHMKYVIH